MGEQYFTSNPNSVHQLKQIQDQIAGVELQLYTDNGVFSKHRIDYGSKVLVETFCSHSELTPEDTVVELGSGYGPIVIALAKRYPNVQLLGVEVNQRAYDLACHNLQLNQVNNASFELGDVLAWESATPVTHVVTNPPIRAGKAVIQRFVDCAYRSLALHGTLWVVIQKKQGAPSMQAYMEMVFGNAALVERDKGYWIIKSVKN